MPPPAMILPGSACVLALALLLSAAAATILRGECPYACANLDDDDDPCQIAWCDTTSEGEVKCSRAPVCDDGDSRTADTCEANEDGKTLVCRYATKTKCTNGCAPGSTYGCAACVCRDAREVFVEQIVISADGCSLTRCGASEDKCLDEGDACTVEGCATNLDGGICTRRRIFARNGQGCEPPPPPPEESADKSSEKLSEEFSKEESKSKGCDYPDGNCDDKNSNGDDKSHGKPEKSEDESKSKGCDHPDGNCDDKNSNGDDKSREKPEKSEDESKSKGCDYPDGNCDDKNSNGDDKSREKPEKSEDESKSKGCDYPDGNCDDKSDNGDDKSHGFGDCTADIDCDDQDACTRDWCLPNGKCQHASICEPSSDDHGDESSEYCRECSSDDECATDDLCLVGICGCRGCCRYIDVCPSESTIESKEESDVDSESHPEWECTRHLDCEDGDPCTDNKCLAHQCTETYVCECDTNEECDDGDDCTYDICKENHKCHYRNICPSESSSSSSSETHSEISSLSIPSGSVPASSSATFSVPSASVPTSESVTSSGIPASSSATFSVPSASVPTSESVTSSNVPVSSSASVPTSESITSSNVPVSSSASVPASESITSSNVPISSSASVPTSESIISSNVPVSSSASVPASESITSSNVPVSSSASVPTSESITSSGIPASSSASVPTSESITSSNVPISSSASVPISSIVASSSIPSEISSEVTGCIKDSDCKSTDNCLVGVCDCDHQCRWIDICGSQIPECVCDEDCTDGEDFCTAGYCDDFGQCQYSNVSAQVCNDHNLCSADSCDPIGFCVFNYNYGRNLCDDDNVCTREWCVPENGTCGHDYTQWKQDCDDKNFCTENLCDPITGCYWNSDYGLELCNSGLDACHNATCDPTLGCDIVEITCESDGDPCTIDGGCDEVEGCVYPKVTQSDVPCKEDGNPCTTNVCEPDTGICLAIPIEDCTLVPCDEDDDCPYDPTLAPCRYMACGTDGYCYIANVAEPGVKCEEDGDVCTTDQCAPGEGYCEHERIAGCSPPRCLDDEDCASTTQDNPCVYAWCRLSDHTCQLSSFPESNISCATDDDNCTKDFCAPGMGFCDHAPIEGCGGDECPEGLIMCDDLVCRECCDDGDCPVSTNVCKPNVCTLDHICAQDPIENCCTLDLECDDQDVCTTNTCNLTTNLCEYPDISNCCYSAAECDDHNDCTDDQCSPAYLCTHTNEPYGTPCNDSAPTDCVLWQCSGGACMSVCAPDQTECEVDADPCTVGKCGAGNCACVETPVPSGPHLCDDMECHECCADEDCPDSGDICNPNVCTPNYVCVPELISGCCEDANDCDDDNNCTTDFCNSTDHTCFHGDAACPADDPFCAFGCSISYKCQSDYQHLHSCLGDDCEVLHWPYENWTAVPFLPDLTIFRQTGIPCFVDDAYDDSLCTEYPYLNSRYCSTTTGLCTYDMYVATVDCSMNYRDPVTGANSVYSSCDNLPDVSDLFCSQKICIHAGEIDYRGVCTITEKTCDDGYSCTEDCCIESEDRCANDVISDCNSTDPCCPVGQLYDEEDGLCHECCDDADCTSILPAGTCFVWECSADTHTCAAAFNPECCILPGMCVDDGDVCTAEICNVTSNVCEHVNISDCCRSNEDCDDENVTMRDWCDVKTGECHHDPIICVECECPQCNDHDRCTRDWCDYEAGCCHHERINCNDGKNCTEDYCSPFTGECIHELPNCADGDACTLDYCDEEIVECVHTPRMSCPVIGDNCTLGACDPKTGECSYSKIDCDDGDWCTADYCDQLSGGECKHDPKVCEHRNCYEASCYPGNGVCYYEPKDCDDDEPATHDWCDVRSGECEHKLNKCHGYKFDHDFEDRENFFIFDDDDEEEEHEHHHHRENKCVEVYLEELTGECLRKYKDCDDENPCTHDKCRPRDGECLHFEKICEDDGLNCTDDYCDRNLGRCIHPPKYCGDPDLCTLDKCDEIRGGVCIHVPDLCGAAAPYPSTAPGNYPHCVVLSCYAGTGGCFAEPLSCDDHDACTDDTCEEGIGCLHDRNPCADGLDDTPNYLCTQDICDPETGECLHPLKDCDDHIPITVDWCDPLDGECKHEDNTCVNLDPCFVNKTSKTDGKCHAVPIDCRDGNPCTEDYCLRGECMHPMLDCDDHDACTKDYLDRETCMCVHKPKDCEGCDKCMEYGCEPETGCWARPKDCGDGDRCTLDRCNEKTGECYNPELPGMDDHDLCTTDFCSNGTIYHIPVVCDDRDPCTIDSCDATTGQCEFQDRVCRVPGRNKCLVAECKPCTPDESEHPPREEEKYGGHDHDHDDEDHEHKKECIPENPGEIDTLYYECEIHEIHYDLDDHEPRGHPQRPGEDDHRPEEEEDEEKHGHDHEEEDNECKRAICNPETGERVIVPAHDGTPCEGGKPEDHDDDEEHHTKNHDGECKKYICLRGKCVEHGRKDDEECHKEEHDHEKPPHHGEDGEHEDHGHGHDHHASRALIIVACILGGLVLVGFFVWFVVFLVTESREVARKRKLVRKNREKEEGAAMVLQQQQQQQSFLFRR